MNRLYILISLILLVGCTQQTIIVQSNNLTIDSVAANIGNYSGNATQAYNGNCTLTTNIEVKNGLITNCT